MDTGEQDIHSWLATVETQIAANERDHAAADRLRAAVRQIAATLLAEHHARQAARAARLPPATARSR
jgi:hypothetical protein